jgi:hypothetical protein
MLGGLSGAAAYLSVGNGTLVQVSKSEFALLLACDQQSHPGTAFAPVKDTDEPSPGPRRRGAVIWAGGHLAKSSMAADDLTQDSGECTLSSVAVPH